eukprot:g4589.t1
MNEKNRLASTRLTQRPWELHDKTISSNLKVTKSVFLSPGRASIDKLKSYQLLTDASFFSQPAFFRAVSSSLSRWYKRQLFLGVFAAKPSPHLFNLWVQVGTKLTAFMSSLSTFFNFSLLFSTSSRLLALILSSSILSQPVFFLPPSYSFSPSARL